MDGCDSCICLFKNVILTSQASQSAAETEDLRRRLEAAETELKLVLESYGGQKDVGKMTEESCRLKEGRCPSTSGAEAECVQSGRSGRKSCRGEAFIHQIPHVNIIFCHPLCLFNSYKIQIISKSCDTF